MEKFDRWDIPGVAGTIMSIIALFRGQAPEAAPRGSGAETSQKTVSSFKAMFGKEDEGIWVSLLATLDAPQRHAITLVLEQLTGINEVDSFRLAVVNAPNVTTTEETRDPAKPKVVVKKVMKAAEFCDEDNRVKFLKAIAALETSVAVNFLRTNKIATENAVTKYGPALLDQLTDAISARGNGQSWPSSWRDWQDMLRRVPIPVWMMGGGTMLFIIGIAIKIYFID